MFAASSGDVAGARSLREQIERDSRHWNRHAREINLPLIREVDDALETARGR